MRLEQLILLLVRATLVLLIVLAMASVMPWAENLWAAIWPDGGGGNANRGARTHHLIVLDASLSMNVAEGGTTLFENGRKLALQRIRNASPGDGFSVLL